MRRAANLSAAILAAGLLLAGADRACAGDPVEDARIAEAENLLERITTFQGAKKKADLERALNRVPKVHNELKTGSMRTKLQKALGLVMKDEALGGTRSVAADTLGRLNDPKGSWGVLKKQLPSVKVEAAGPFELRVIQAVGLLAPDAAISSLLTLMGKAKDANVSRYAIQALGNYGFSKRRTTVLSDLCKALRKLRPGGTDPRLSRGGGRAARERYNFLQLSFVSALNELTGQNHDSADKWLEVYKAGKKDLGSLFTFEK